ncbi:helix-turn-helix domain-containing protein [Kitasatospora sp. NBC_00240]|uniref:helix-turn-helix domain-containing protein n=1 Tax=Kitasatospora sp. NBC_00240 TaxID=2903567 RepID=UPI002254595F|nr:helix-turn-helix transcriptional regulator [Kitasatospora sp. NBC_00240]MCX5211367.1 helix-turn-helix domain-containing protein [Kitasatospora sp. NBC_00240]
MPAGASTVLGRQLGEELRSLREASGLSTSEVAEVLDCTKGKISRIENGRVALRSPDLAAMLRLYGAEDADAIARFSDLARSANQRRRSGWWNEYGNIIGETYRDYISLEAVASAVHTFQSQRIPALLQLPSYTRALAVASHGWTRPEEIEQFTSVRLARQERLTADEPLQIWTVLSEAVLRQQVGGPDVMRDQLTHLELMSERPNVTVQVIPFSAGAHASMAGPYVILRFPATGALDLVLLDTPTGSTWLERSPEVETYQALWNNARTKALSPVESRRLITSIKESNQ